MSRSWIRLAPTALCLVLTFSAPADADAPTVAALREWTHEAMADTGVRGAAVALIRDGRVVWLEGLGVRDERSGEPVTSRTVFQAASLGKVVAAYGALLRMQDGDWGLAMPVASPRLRVGPDCRPPTLGDLLSHSAGLGNDLRASELQPACHPPVPFAYSGQGFLVLQDLFAMGPDARGAEAFLRERVFEPLGMRTATFATPSRSDLADLATGHADLLYGVLTGAASSRVRGQVLLLAVVVLVALGLLARRAWNREARLWSAARIALLALGVVAFGLWSATRVFVPVDPWDTRILLPSSLHASAEDMARFVGELLHPRLLSPEVHALLFEPRVAIDDELAWGAGIGIDRVSGPQGTVTSYWQWGSNPGFQGLMVVVPARRDALVVLTNTGGFADVLLGDRGGYLLAKRLARRALDLPGRWDLVRPAP